MISTKNMHQYYSTEDNDKTEKSTLNDDELQGLKNEEKVEGDLLEEIDMITSFIDPNEVDISLTYELEEELSSPNDLSITQEELDRKYGKEQP